MVEFIIILTGSLVILAALFGLGTRRKLGLVAAILIGVGLFFTIARGAKLKTELSKTDWPVVMGKVLTSDIIGQRAFHPEIKFEYSIGDKIYQAQDNLLTPGFGSRSKRREVAIKSIVPYPPGADVEVHYNPNNPAQAVLRISPSHGDYIGLSFGILLLVGGGISAWNYRRVTVDQR